MSKYDDTKFYWLILKDDFFENDAIEWLEDQKPNGREYAYFYLKLCLKALKTNGILIREVGEILIPYDERKLAELTRCDFDTVVVAMELLKQIGLIKILDNKAIYIQGLENLIGSQSKGAFKKQQQRQLKRNSDNTLLPTGVDSCPPSVSQVSPNCPTEEEIEQEEEKEFIVSEDTIRAENSSTTETTKNIRIIVNAWNSMCEETGLHKVMRINPTSTRYKMLKTRIAEYDMDAVLQAIENIKKSSFLKGDNRNGWTISFDWFVKPNNFPKVLEGNYTDGQKSMNGGFSFDNL